MGLINHEFMNQVSLILGILVLIACIFGDIPEPHRMVWIICMPFLMIVNYVSLIWLSQKKDMLL
jgi:hypothetical protein